MELKVHFRTDIMSDVKTTRIWNGLKVDEFTNTETGKMELREFSNTSAQGTLLASSPNFSWTIDNSDLFLRLYNSRTPFSSKLTGDEFEQLFYNDGRKLFNDDRASVLNNDNSYNTVELAYDKKISFVQLVKVPGVQDPKTGQVVNNNGTLTSSNPFAVSNTPSNKGVPTVNSYYQPANVDPGLDTNVTFATPRQTNFNRRNHSGTMRYPEANLTSFGYDYIQFTGHKYSARGFSEDGSGRIKLGALTKGSSYDRLGKSLGTVQLPMIPASETHSVEWGKSMLNAIQGNLAGTAFNTINDLSNFDLGEAGRSLINGLKNTAGEIINDDNTTNFLKSYFAGQAVGVNNLASRATGSVLNPNMELLFTGPQLRQFNFNFPLTPRSEKETETIRRIIKFFKKNMAPSHSNSELFLYSPNIFKVEYIHNGDGQHPFMNKFKPCALTSFTTTYGQPNSYMTYDNASLTQYNISMTFSEIEVIYQEDQTDGTEDMGY